MKRYPKIMFPFRVSKIKNGLFVSLLFFMFLAFALFLWLPYVQVAMFLLSLFPPLHLLLYLVIFFLRSLKH